MAILNPTISEHSLKFRSEKSRQTALFVWIPAFLVLAGTVCSFIFEDLSRGNWFMLAIFFIIDGSICWMWFDTGYEISGTHLLYHSGFMNGKIAIDSIRKIERKKEIFSGMKPALGIHGIIVHYNNYDDIYLSPENQDVFIEELLKRNNNIVLAF